MSPVPSNPRFTLRMTAPLCSTFLNATTAPDFPGDISGFFHVPSSAATPAAPHRHHHPLPSIVERNDHHRSDGGVSGKTAGTNDLSLVPPPIHGEEKRRYADGLRTRNSYFDKLEKMKAVMGRRHQRQAIVDAGQTLFQGQTVSSENDMVDGTMTSGSAKSAESGLTAVTSTDDAEKEASNDAAAIVRSGEDLLRKSALLSRLQSRLAIKDEWNKEGVAEMLCPARTEKDIRDLETALNRLERLIQNESKIAVYLQRPPRPCLLLDPAYHEATTRVLGGEALKTVLEVVDAAEAVERFVHATSGDGDQETQAVVTRLTEHLEREKNHLSYMMSIVKKAVDAADVRV